MIGFMSRSNAAWLNPVAGPHHHSVRGSHGRKKGGTASSVLSIKALQIADGHKRQSESLRHRAPLDGPPGLL